MTRPLALGIDAGGTYTDLVLLDLEQRNMVAAAKSSTTRPDPSPGIHEGLRRLPAEGLARVAMVSLATTFATNAIVEEVGAEAGLILIGYDQAPEVIPRGVRVMMLSGGHTVSGEEKSPLDLDRLDRNLPAFVQGLEAVAVTGFFSVRNPAHERIVAEAVRRRFDLPVVRGHRLSMKLDAHKRAVTAWWNARLIPLISNLIRACRRVLAEADLSAPLMVVRGDGTLMSATTALERPVDTLLSGPAASILGARYLAGVKDCLIVDMGGTTTDMAVLEQGRVLIDPQGARVGRWETHVEAAKVRTIGLGGDSLISVNGHKSLEVGPRRVVPLCMQAERHPELMDLLREVSRRITSEPCRGVNPCSFYFPANSQAVEPHLALYPSSLMASEYLLWTKAGSWCHTLDLEEDEREGKYVRSGLTPTDLRVAAGRFSLGNTEAAGLGRDIMARHLGLDGEALTEAVEETISRRLSLEAVVFIAGEDQAALAELAPRWYPVQKTAASGVGLALNLALTAPVVGVGAPAPVCIPQAFSHLNTETILPEGYDVSVAVGAVVGLVDMTFGGSVRPGEAGGFVLFTPTAKLGFKDLEEAIQEGRRLLEAQALEEMSRNYVDDPLITFTAEEKKARSSGGQELHLETELKVRATGRPAVDDRDLSWGENHGALAALATDNKVRRLA
ncbi:MAG: hydantoinase/oxoprolinase family protein [Thermodesulfobacteriota bacterium]